MKPTNPIKSKKFKDRRVFDTIFGIQVAYYDIKTKNELLEFIKEKSSNTYAIIKVKNKYLFIIKIGRDNVFISTINGNIDCIPDIIED